MPGINDEADLGYYYAHEAGIYSEKDLGPLANYSDYEMCIRDRYGATIGKVGILGIAATTNQACACGISNPSTNYKYLFYYACLLYTSRKMIPLKMVYIPVPPEE